MTRRSVALRRTLLCAAALAFVASGTVAGERGSSALMREIKTLTSTGRFLEAAERIGAAAAAAHAAGDLQAEYDAAQALEACYAAAPSKFPPADGATSDKLTGAGVLVVVMRKLDPARCAAYVSAPALSRSVLRLATQTGSFDGVADAAKVATAHRLRVASGRAGAVFAKYAEGLVAVAEGRPADAVVPLQQAGDEASAEKWFDLATHAVTELAAAWVKLGSPEKAEAAVAAMAALLRRSPDPLLARAWSQMAQARLAGAPETILAPVKELSSGSVSASGAGGAGGKGQRAEDDPRSEIAKALPKLSSTDPFVSVKRGRAGFEIVWAFDPPKKASEPFKAGVEVVAEGGVTLATDRWSVCLLRVSLDAGAGGLGGRSHLSPVHALYPLAQGEMYRVTKEGVVSIAR